MSIYIGDICKTTALAHRAWKDMDCRATQTEITFHIPTVVALSHTISGITVVFTCSITAHSNQIDKNTGIYVMQNINQLIKN